MNGLFSLLPAAGPTAEPDMTNQYNTDLSPSDEKQFMGWARSNDRMGDLYDYDLRGWWKENHQIAGNGHMTDKFKKPNHPTFSDQSQYNGVDGHYGGTWGGTDEKPTFTPSPDNLQNLSPMALQDYFKRVEPDTTLILPPNGQSVSPVLSQSGNGALSGLF